MEHIIASNRSKHLSKHNVLYVLQHWFREKTLTRGPIDSKSRRLWEDCYPDLILLDFSKAFGKVNHLKLLYKHSCFGVKGNTLNAPDPGIFAGGRGPGSTARKQL